MRRERDIVGLDHLRQTQPVLLNDVITCNGTYTDCGRTSVSVHIDVQADRNGKAESLQVGINPNSGLTCSEKRSILKSGLFCSYRFAFWRPRALLQTHRSLIERLAITSRLWQRRAPAVAWQAMQQAERHAGHASAVVIGCPCMVVEAPLICSPWHR